MAWVLAFLLAGSLVYCLLVLLAVRSFVRQAFSLPTAQQCAISILKPLSGAEQDLELNLRGFFEQNYGHFEIVCAVRTVEDPAIPIVESLQREFPQVQSGLIITGEPPYANAKVFSLARMLTAACHDLIVMSDSDIRVGPDFLSNIATEFSDPNISLATCPYRAIGGPSLWSRLEAVGMNTEFLGGLLVSRLLIGVDFAVGPTIVARRHVLDAVGFETLREYLAEDFVMGKTASGAGFRVVLSGRIVEHRIGSETFAGNMAHRLRWVRSTRRSRPAGYIGQLFTNPLPIALLLFALQPAWWPVLVPTLILRGLAAWAVSVKVLREPVQWRLLPVQDLLSFVFWIAGFFGNTIVWRGRRYYLHSDGRFSPI